MDRAALNEAKSLVYRDPEIALVELREIELLAAASDVSESVRTLRTNDLKNVREYRQAAIFCHGISFFLKQKVLFCPTDRHDHDFIATWQVDDERHFVPVQLKELVPEHLNPKSTLDEIVKKLSKYKSSTDLTVVIFLNREGSFNPSRLALPANIQISGLWIVTRIGDDRWRLVGDWVNCLQHVDFDYPRPITNHG